MKTGIVDRGIAGRGPWNVNFLDRVIGGYPRRIDALTTVVRELALEHELAPSNFCASILGPGVSLARVMILGGY